MKCSLFGVSYPDLQNKMDEVGQNAKTLSATFVRVAWTPHQEAFTLGMAKKAVDNFNCYGNGETRLVITDDVEQGEGAEDRYERSQKGWGNISKGLKEVMKGENTSA